MQYCDPDMLCGKQRGNNILANSSLKLKKLVTFLAQERERERENRGILSCALRCLVDPKCP